MNARPNEMEQILARAASRGQTASLTYAGEVTPQEAYRLFSAYGSKIIDVRSRFENQYVGRIPGAPLVPWKHWPSGETNTHFLTELQARCETSDIVLFLCRSGIRSHSTAIVAAAAGFKLAFNILEGFEGDLDQHRQRGNTGGWRKAGLPWVQD